MKTFISKHILLLIIIGLGYFNAQAQDYNFTQYHYTPLLTNPAMVSSQDDISVFMNYRNQPTIIDENFQNIMFSGIYPLINSKRRWGGIGATFVNDQNGRFLRLNGGMLAFSYNVQLGKKHYLGLGLQGGYFQRSIDYSAETTSSQWDEFSSTFVEGLGQGEEGFNNTSSYFTLGTGLWWQLEDENGRPKAWLSAAFHNVNEPNISFYNEVDTPLRIRGTYAGAYRVWENDKWEIMPTFRLVSRSNQDQFNLGSWARYKLSNGDGFIKQGSIGVGLWYNFNDAFVPSVEFVQPRYFAAFSFDIATSEDAQLWQGNSTFELTLGVKFPQAAKARKQEIPFSPLETLASDYPSIPDNTSPVVDVVKVKVIEDEFTDEGNFRFALASSNLDERSAILLDSVVKVLNKYPDATITVAGHSCDIGAADRNLVLSKNRAGTMKQYLVQRGIDPSRVATTGYGESKPLVPNTSEANRKINRRVSFHIHHTTRVIDLDE